MKYTNIKKLLIKFMGGGLVNFPTRFLRWVKIEGDTEGGDGGGGGGDGEDASEEAFLFQVLTIINSTEGFYFDENTSQNYVFPISDYDDSWAEGTTLLGDKETADYVIVGYNTADDIAYTIFVTADELNTLEELYYPYKNYYNDWRKNKFAFPINSYINYLQSNLHISDGIFSLNGNVIPNLFWYLKDTALVYGVKGEDIGTLGTEFNQDLNDIFEIPETKFTFNPPVEGIYSGFVFADYNLISNNTLTDLNNLSQRIYKAGETDFDEIYLVELRISNNEKFYTIYAKSKTNDWSE